MTPKKISAADRSVHYLPETCSHGGYDPHRCSLCRHVATSAANAAARKKEDEARALRRRQVEEVSLQTAEEAETVERLAQFQAEKYPHIPEAWKRAVAYARDKQAWAEWDALNGKK